MNKNFNEMSFDELKCYRGEGPWRSLGLLLSHYSSDYRNGLDGSEPCFSFQSESFSSYWFDYGHCALWLPDASDGSKSRDAEHHPRIGSRNQGFEQTFPCR